MLFPELFLFEWILKLLLCFHSSNLLHEECCVIKYPTYFGLHKPFNKISLCFESVCGLDWYNRSGPIVQRAYNKFSKIRNS